MHLLIVGPFLFIKKMHDSISQNKALDISCHALFSNNNRLLTCVAWVAFVFDQRKLRQALHIAIEAICNTEFAQHTNTTCMSLYFREWNCGQVLRQSTISYFRIDFLIKMYVIKIDLQIHFFRYTQGRSSMQISYNIHTTSWL